MQTGIKDIINDCINGDRAAQYKLYNILAPKLRVVCRRYSGSKEDVEDALQESFIKIFTSIKSYRGEGDVAAWARKIAINVLITRLNKQKMSMQSIDWEDEKHLSVPSHLDTAGDLKEQDLLNLLDRLNLRSKIVFNLFVIEGYDHNEISEMLGISSSNSRSTLSRARQDLLAMLQNIKAENEQRLAR